MKTKKIYQTPDIALIVLDNQISLVLLSAPPEGPEEGFQAQLNNCQQDPFNIA